FTNDPAKMLAALKAVEVDPNLRVEGQNRTRENILKMKQAEDDCAQCPMRMAQEAVERVAANSAHEDRMRTLRSLAALRAVIAFLHTGSTRSEVFYFTDGFVADPGAFYGAPDEPDLRAEILSLAWEASQAQAAIHTINTQGVPAGGQLALFKSEPPRDWNSAI